ncbi:MAG: glycosyltransferase [Proteobacteria bacterium]|nr:glycosyltransferase [Pseudomonadota bacterium]
MPLFSVITITKGDPAGFMRTKASVDAQTFRDFELVVIDGDREPDQGIYDAMNKGCDRAQGQYLIFMNGGDAFAAPDVLERVAPYLGDGPDFVYGDAYEMSSPCGNDMRSAATQASCLRTGPQSRPCYYKPARHNIAHGMLTHHQAMFYKAGPRRYDLKYKIAADYKFTAHAVQEAKTVQYVPVAVCIFEEGGISQRRVKQGRDEQTAIRRELGINAPFIDIVQFAASALKKLFPVLYWALRSRFSTSLT